MQQDAQPREDRDRRLSTNRPLEADAAERAAECLRNPWWIAAVSLLPPAFVLIIGNTAKPPRGDALTLANWIEYENASALTQIGWACFFCSQAALLRSLFGRGRQVLDGWLLAILMGSFGTSIAGGVVTHFQLEDLSRVHSEVGYGLQRASRYVSLLAFSIVAARGIERWRERRREKRAALVSSV